MNGFRKMNRADRELSSDDAKRILEEGKVGVLSVMGAEGYPYGVPMNYAYVNGELLFHTSSGEGLLLESLESNPRASFCVHEHVRDSMFRSVIAFGTVSFESDRRRIVGSIVDKYVPEPFRGHVKEGIDGRLEQVCGLSMSVEHLTAKYIDKPGE